MPRFYLAILLTILAIIPQANAQGGYLASWHRGLMGASFNPAFVAGGTHSREVNLIGGDLRSGNNLLATNLYGQFYPVNLVRGLKASAGALPLFTAGNQDGFTFQGQQANWTGWQENHILGPGYSRRLETNPNLIERGLLRQAVFFQTGREEHINLSGLPADIAKYYHQNWKSDDMAPSSLVSDAVGLEVNQWDYLQVGYGFTLGRGLRLLHIGLSGQLRSVGAFGRANMWGTTWDFSENDLRIQADSMYWAYNPGFAGVISPTGGRRYNYFENSWGLSGGIGLVFQTLDYNRKPKWEVGAAWQQIGLVQYWNLDQTSYETVTGSLEYSEFGSARSGVSGIEALVGMLEADSMRLENGITESLPQKLSAHAKVRLGGGPWAIQVDGTTQLNWAESSLSRTRIRATLAVEEKSIALYFPLVMEVHSFKSGDLDPSLGFVVSLRDVFVLGSDDVLSNMVLSATRQGVYHSNLFIGLHVLIDRDF